MLSHERVWAAVYALASQHGMTPSGLARKSGLDATSFNRSKRLGPEGRERWPSTESISKTLKATGATLEEFLRLIDPSFSLPPSMIPLIGMEAAQLMDALNEGMPTTGPGCDAIGFPDSRQDKVFALEITGSDLSPVYRDGDILIVSPTATVRKGDRIILCTIGGQILAQELRRRTASTLETISIADAQESRTMPVEEIFWCARIMWVRQ